MLDIYNVALEGVREIAGLVEAIGRHDGDLVRQLRRATQSVPLNIAEGHQGRGGNRLARYQDALGSAKEVRACLDVAEAFGYLTGEQTFVARDRFDHVAAALYRLTHRR